MADGINPPRTRLPKESGDHDPAVLSQPPVTCPDCGKEMIKVRTSALYRCGTPRCKVIDARMLMTYHFSTHPEDVLQSRTPIMTVRRETRAG